MPQSQKLENIEDGLKRAATVGELDLELGGRKLPVEQLVFSGEQKIVCEPGSVPQGDVCGM